MCALFGWLDCGKKLPHKLLKKFTQELANASEERGTDASGISYVQDGRIKIYKKPKPAHKMKFTFPENTTAIMGHTRFRKLILKLTAMLPFSLLRNRAS